MSQFTNIRILPLVGIYPLRRERRPEKIQWVLWNGQILHEERVRNTCIMRTVICIWSKLNNNRYYLFANQVVTLSKVFWMKARVRSQLCIVCWRRKHCNDGVGHPPLYVNVNMRSGEMVNNWVDALQAAWPGIQVDSCMVVTNVFIMQFCWSPGFNSWKVHWDFGDLRVEVLEQVLDFLDVSHMQSTYISIYGD